ncbi:hypothetical protein [Streptomyces sp. SID3343]|uniref:hypothetical protein n=1 Tax=Streptomyces sp. SID3343 TaxID=2690260 RepID=UPI0031F734A1
MGAVALAASGQAQALPMAPGDNGDVKIHATSTLPTDQNNDPKVCRFYLAAFDFDTLTKVTYTISQQPPTGTDQVLGGMVTLVTGIGNTATLSLPDGHYKLDWTFEGETGGGKHKVFQVDCPENSPTTDRSLFGSVNAGGGGGASQYSPGQIAAGSAIVATALGSFGMYVVRRRRATGDGES